MWILDMLVLPNTELLSELLLPLQELCSFLDIFVQRWKDLQMSACLYVIRVGSDRNTLHIALQTTFS